MRRFWFAVIAALVVLDLGVGAYLWLLVTHKAPPPQVTSAGRDFTRRRTWGLERHPGRIAFAVKLVDGCAMGMQRVEEAGK